MATNDEKRRILNRILVQSPYDPRPELWIYLIWLCPTIRKDGKVSYTCMIFLFTYLQRGDWILRPLPPGRIP
jgi:hypothetical protein